MKVGLVLEGGGLRGLYTAGVLDQLLDMPVGIAGIVSVSSGALFGVNFISRQKGRVLRYNGTYLNDKRYMGWQSWITTGNMVNKQFAYYDVPFMLDPFDNDVFKQAKIPFYAVVTNMETGEAEYRRIDDVYEQMEELRASSALPFFSRNVWLDGKPYLDGGIADSIPVEFAQTLGFDKLIVVLTRPRGYKKEKEISKWLSLVYARYPKFKELLLTRSFRYNKQIQKIDELERQGKVFVIAPSRKIEIGRLEKSVQKLHSTYDLGVNDMNSRAVALSDFLQ